MRLKSITPLLLSCALLLSGCGELPQSSPYPYDHELIQLFYNNADMFETLKNGTSNEASLKSLGILSVSSSNSGARDDKVVTVWVKDLFGTGYCTKGFAYMATVPALLVSEIGPQLQECPPEQGRIYRRIAGNWYLYYESYN